jgi:hypothetical protein
MKKPKLPKFETVEQMAEFFDTHDMTDYEDEFEVVKEPVFVRPPAIKLHLEPRQVQALGRMAKAKGVSREELIREWVLEKLVGKKRTRRTKHPA